MLNDSAFEEINVSYCTGLINLIKSQGHQAFETAMSRLTVEELKLMETKS